MVFEKVVADVLNRVLGDYVENLDASQLKIGIFGGDVNLTDLIVKSTALDDLNVPFKVAFGHISKLTMNIPWKDIYGSPVVATIDGVYVVVVPSSGAKYDEQKELKALQDAKQKALLKNEEMKIKQAELKSLVKPQKEDTLIEKIVAQIVKNVQVKITNIHVRYEDNFTNPARPFCFGVTLNKLSFETTDENWKPRVVESTEHIFHKLVSLDSFSFYWNSRVRLIAHLSPREIKAELVNNIAADGFKPPDVGYMVGPITSTARMKINQKPEMSDYKMPSTTVDILVEDISIGMSKCQYHDIIALADSMQRMWLADRYRKYHPQVPVKSHAKQWWKFAYKATLEEQVRPRRKQWSVDFLLGHIRKVKEYRKEYKSMLTTKKSSARLKILEEELDLFSIILARRQAEFEVEKLPKPEPKKGWFGGWWGGSTKETGGNEIVSSLAKEITPEEKAKLYAAIDYNENQVPPEYPLYFVDKKLNFLLKTLSISIADDTRRAKVVVMRTTLNGVSSSVEMRPKGDALKVAAKIESFKIESFPGNENACRTLLTSDRIAGVEKKTAHLLDVTFETNPIEGGCDQKIRVNAEPVEMFYDVRSFDSLLDVFKPPDTVSIDNIQNQAASGLKSLRVLSATGLQHAIDNKPSLDILARVKPSYILIYEGGRIDDSKNVLVLSMGELVVKSKARDKDAPTVQQLVAAGSSEKEILEAMFNNAYDKMEIHLSTAELLVVPACKVWRDCVSTAADETHIIQPTDLYVNIDICFLPDEKRIPKVKVSGKLPSLEISLSDEKLINLLKIVSSMKGDPKELQSTGHGKLKDMGQSMMVEDAPVGISGQGAQVVRDTDAQNVQIVPQEGSAERKREDCDEIVMHLSFEVTKFLVRVQEVVYKEHDGLFKKQYNPLLEFATNELRAFLVMHPLDMSCEVTLKNTELTHLAYTFPSGVSEFRDKDNKPLTVLQSSVDPGTGHMLRITYIAAEPKHPEFRTRFNNTLAAVKCHVGEMTFALHQQAIVSLMGFANKLVEQLDMSSTTQAPASTAVNNPMTQSTISQSQLNPSQTAAKKVTGAPRRPAVIQFSAHASLAALKIILCKTGRYLAIMNIRGMEAGVEQTRRKMISNVKLRSISMDDPNAFSKHPHIIAITGDDVLNMKICQYEESGQEGYTDMEKVDISVEAVIGRMHFVFLWQFYLDIMSFLDSFQAAKDKVADATAAAAAAAKVGMELAYAKAFKLALNVSVNAPVIYVPQSSKSRHCLVMDFGVLSIGNSFQPGPAVAANCVPILYENTKISIDNLMMSRCKLKPGSTDAQDNTEFSIMDPVSFSLDVQRNLTAAAHKTLPELKMKGTIKSVLLRIGKEDYSAIMRILSMNFAETPPGYQTPEEQNKVVPPTSSTSGALSTVKEVVTVERHEKREVDENKLVRIEVFFTLQEIVLQLYSQRDSKNCEGLCTLNIEGFKLCGNFNHDNSFWVNMFLVNLVLDDCRSSRKTGIRRLITKSEDNEKMIDIIYQAESTGAFAAIVQVSRIRFVYSATLNLALLDFIKVASEEDDKKEQSSEVNQAKKAAPSIATVTTTSANAPPPSTSPQRIIPFTIILQINQPDVLLVADLESPESACIIFKSSVNIRVKQDETKMDIKAELSDIELFVSCLDKAQSCGVRSEILQRCCIVCEMEQTPKSQNVKIDVTPIEIHMTPSAVEIVSSSLGALGGDKAGGTEDAPIEFFDPRKIWMPQVLIENSHLWYIKKEVLAVKAVEEAQEAVETIVQMKETATFSMENIIITLEQGSGAQTMPMLLMNLSLKGDAKNWSSALELSSLLHCVVFYYNERYAVWEPLLESVETLSGVRKPWEVLAQVTAAPTSPPPDPSVPACQLPALYSIRVSCNDNLELTLTKTAVQVLLALGREFANALHKDVVDSQKVGAPYCVENTLGIPFTVNVEASNFIIVTTEDDSSVVEDGKKLYLDFRNRMGLLSVMSDKGNMDDVNQSKYDDMFFNVRMTFGNNDADRKLSVNHTAKRVFRVPFRSYPGDDWSFVVDVSSHYGSRLVTLYSIVEVFNAFSVPMEVYYESDKELILCSTIQPKSLAHVPLVALYTFSNKLLFKPAGHRFQTSQDPIIWKSIETMAKERQIVSKSSNPNKASFYMNVTGSAEELPYDDSPTEKCKIYRIRLNPTVLVNNLLPVPISIKLKESNVEFELAPGESVELWNAKLCQSTLCVLLEYNGKKWQNLKVLQDDMEELSAMSFMDSGNPENILDLGVHCEKKDSCSILSIHCPFWMVNMTTADLKYKADNCVEHSGTNTQPVLFSFGSKQMFAPKKKISVKIFDSDWSEKFSLDAVGQSGTIVAKSPTTGLTYALSVSIDLSSTTLTRIVRFSPFYMVMNNSKFGPIECRENKDKSQWIRVEKGQCVPLWPSSVAKVELVCRYAGTVEETIPFSLKESNSVLLKLNNKFAGIFISCQVEESAAVVSFSEYEDGLSAVFLVNDTNENVMMRQEFSGAGTMCVHVGKSMHYVWDDPRENRQILCWVRDDDICKVGPLTDGFGVIENNDKKVYWVSFLDGKQRVLLFSNDGEHLEQVEKVGSFERTDYEFELEFHGLGLSLVDDEPFRREIDYMSVSGSGAHWESRSRNKNKYKAFSPEMSQQLEMEYQRFLNLAKSVGSTTMSAVRVAKYTVNFGANMITAPEPKVIRRNNRPGLWLHVKKTENQTTVHLKVHRIQMDNQVRDCNFPVILSPVIMKRHVGEQKMVKPFIEMSVIMRQFQGSQLRQIKYCKLLIQEFAIRIDMCFVNSLLAFMALSEKKTGYLELVERDIKFSSTSLREIASQHAVQGQRDYIDYLHLSPMKIHLSFSMNAGGSAPPPPSGAFSGVKLLLQSFGVTLTDLQGAVLKLDYFERKHDFLTLSQLNGDVVSHYTKQALRQVYVVIFGLDVLGNPMGLLVGFTTGVGDLFYEPLQGAIQGPEEFVAGLAQGVASLIGHTVGGAAEAVGKITGALGKGVAALTMDEEFQKKRRLERNKRPQDITEGIAQSGKDLVMGFYDGVTGVVTKPIEGAREDGVTGFMKGMGKGLIGAVARPASGVVDFASGTLASVKRATELEEVATPVRPPRLIRNDGIVLPYNKMEAEGHQLLQEVENGKYSATDTYLTHLSVCSDGRNYVILTSQRVLFVEKGDIFGHWNCEWNYAWDQIKPPLVIQGGVKVLLKEPKKKGLFQSKESGKIINITDPQISQWLCQQMQRAMSKNT